jgi:hypothetical protein
MIREIWDEADHVERGLLVLLIPFSPALIAVYAAAWLIGSFATLIVGKESI